MANIEYDPAMQEALFTQAKIADLSQLADLTMRGLGSDRSIEDDFLWHAQWESTGQPPYTFALTHEIGDDGQFCYWLEVADEVYDFPEGKIGFTPDTGSMNTEAVDGETVRLFRGQDRERWGRLERQLYHALATSPVVDSEHAHVNAGWGEQWEALMAPYAEEMVIRSAAADPEMKQYVRDYDPRARLRSQQQRRAGEIIMQRYGLNKRQLAQASELVLNNEEE